MKRRRGNPNWLKPEGLNLPIKPTQLELLLNRLGIDASDTENPSDEA